MKSPLLPLSVAVALGLRDDSGFERAQGGPAFDRGVHVTTTRDGGHAAVGVTGSYGAAGDGRADLCLVKGGAER